MAKAKLSIGPAVDKIPSVNRKHRRGRVDTVRKALMAAAPGTILPVYTASDASAANLALILRKTKGLPLAKAVVRKHIIYVQRTQDAVAQDVVATDAVATVPELNTTNAV